MYQGQKSSKGKCRYQIVSRMTVIFRCSLQTSITELLRQEEGQSCTSVSYHVKSSKSMDVGSFLLLERDAILV